MLRLTPHSVQEWAELVEVKPTAERYPNIYYVATHLSTGSKNAEHPSFATHAMDKRWPEEQARVVVLNDQGHTANLEAPGSSLPTR